MAVIWKVIITLVLLYVTVADANRARRRRQTEINSQAANQNAASNTFNSHTDSRQRQLPNPVILNSQGGQPQQQIGQGGEGLLKNANLGQMQAGRQFNAYQNPQYGGQQQGLNYNPYGGAGAGSQYNTGQYGAYGQGQGPYANYYQNQNQQNPYGNQGSSNFYSGGSSYNRPGYGQSGYGQGGYGQGGYGQGGYGFWGAGQKQNANIFIVFLSSFLALTIYSITI
ncbi:unnamed protein product [Adineta steineri]|uniref:Uncharacterized protein n=1 Tax=Adineta steineri TaxID=433720 RepID=A0A813SR57_9BILA|nr:unnamed protein product [Adineta steineri]